MAKKPTDVSVFVSLGTTALDGVYLDGDVGDRELVSEVFAHCPVERLVTLRDGLSDLLAMSPVQRKRLAERSKKNRGES